MANHISLTQLASSILGILYTSTATDQPQQRGKHRHLLQQTTSLFETDAKYNDWGSSINSGVAQTPYAVRKMSADPAEMFFYEYWKFFEYHEDAEKLVSNGTNITGSSHLLSGLPDPDYGFQPPMLPLVEAPGQYRNLLPRFMFGRSFTCPAGTNSCASIGRPNSCCQQGLTCDIVKDTGQGDVGCCPNSQGCQGNVAACPSGYSTCADQEGGGCCIPGYECQGVGCVQTIQTVVQASTTINAPASTQSQARSTSTASNCFSGFQTCAISLGGGCCPPDHVCVSSASCQPKTSSHTSTVVSPISTVTASMPAAPVRGTSDTSLPTTVAPAQVHTSGPCPSNFYPCSAYFPGAGCCQIGRDCASISCPARTTISQLVSNGVTILVEPTVSDGQQDNCAAGWSTCASNIGGGCCPGGYICGTASCTVAGSTSQVAKESKGASNRNARFAAIFSYIIVFIFI